MNVNMGLFRKMVDLTQVISGALGYLGVQAFLEANSRFFTFQGGAFTESPYESLSSSISWGAFLHGRGTSGL